MEVSFAGNLSFTSGGFPTFDCWRVYDPVVIPCCDLSLSAVFFRFVYFLKIGWLFQLICLKSHWESHDNKPSKIIPFTIPFLPFDNFKHGALGKGHIYSWFTHEKNGIFHIVLFVSLFPWNPSKNPMKSISPKVSIWYIYIYIFPIQPEDPIDDKPGKFSRPRRRRMPGRPKPRKRPSVPRGRRPTHDRHGENNGVPHLEITGRLTINFEVASHF